MPPTIRRPTWLDVMRLFFVGAVWGGSFIFISLALADFGPVSIAAWRIFLAALVLLGVSLLARQRLPRGVRPWCFIFVIGLLNSAIPFYLINWGQQFISSAESALLMAAGTFCSLIISHFVSHDERINILRALGVIIGFSGVVVLLLWDLFESGFGELKGQIAVIGAGCSYAVSAIIARQITHLPSISVSTGTMLIASLYMVPLAFLMETPFPEHATTKSMVSLFYLGVIGTALAFVIRFSIIRANGAVFMSQVGYLVPLFGVIWSWLYFSDVINIQTWISLALILIGIAITRRGS